MTAKETTPVDFVPELPRMPAADVKKRGWRSVMRTLSSQGPLLVTNHSQPEAVILSPSEYARLLTISKEAEAKAEAELDALRQRFDSRLAALQRKGASDRLRRIVAHPAKLGGKVKAGAGS